MTFHDVESATIAERDAHFPTDFVVRYGYRPEPHPGMDRRTVRLAWAVIALAILAAALFFAVGPGAVR